ncbi:MAG: proline racemase family protein [Phycisphaerales bacterium]|nr:proline racemase family protein [Phycisphaerales bacterium]
MQRISIIDSHTEGEPTRVIIAGGPELGGGSIAEQLRVFREKFDHVRSAVVNEPRGCDHLVGAIICKAVNPRAAAGVIFFNNVGFLNGCGHGTIGLAATLLHLGRIGAGSHIIETPVGEVTVSIADDRGITITNVPSYRHAKDVPVAIDWRGGARTVRGDIAWGGNWFFLVNDTGEHGHGLELSLKNIDVLREFSCAVRGALDRERITGADGGIIDHIELFGPPTRGDCQSRNFVLCPGKEYDRSPCGTGTSAKLACLAADGKLAPGAEWGQESIIGSAFFGRYAGLPASAGGSVGGAVVGIRPEITGRACITAESTLILDPRDPFVHGLRG